MDSFIPPKPVELRKRAIQASFAEHSLPPIVDDSMNETLEGCSLSATDCVQQARAEQPLPTWENYWDEARTVSLPDR